MKNKVYEAAFFCLELTQFGLSWSWLGNSEKSGSFATLIYTFFLRDLNQSTQILFDLIIDFRAIIILIR